MSEPEDLSLRSFVCLVVGILAICCMMAAMSGCARIAGPDGDSYYVGTVVSAQSDEGCFIDTQKHSTDDGRNDDGKTQAASVTVTAPGPNARCVVGGGISDNLKAFGTFLLGLLL